MKTTVYLFLISVCILQAQVVNKITFDRFTHYEADDWITYGYSNYITSIDIGPENIYFGTTAGGILRYNLFDEEWLFPMTTSNGLRSNHVINVVFDYETNQLFARTDRGIDVFNLAFQYWQPGGDKLPVRRSADYAYQRSDDYRFPAFSRPPVSNWPNFFPEKNYQIMLDGKIYDPDNQLYEVTDRIVDSWNKLWIGTNGSGIARGDLDMQDIFFRKQSIAAVYPKDVLIDGNNIWIAGTPFDSDERGIARWNSSEDQWEYYKSGIISSVFSDDVQVMAKIGKEIFFGTEQGLMSYNKKQEKWISYQRGNVVKSDKIYDLLAHKNILYIATVYGFFVFDPHTKTFSQPANHLLKQNAVYKLCASDSSVFLATNQGIVQFDLSSQKLNLLDARTAIADNYISAVGYYRGKLWFAGLNGIGYTDTKTAIWKSYPALNLSFKNEVTDIAFTDLYVWFATNNGLLKYDPDRDYWYLYTTEDGLADNRVSRIDVDGDFLWLSTPKGVTQFRWYSDGRFE